MSCQALLSVLDSEMGGSVLFAPKVLCAKAISSQMVPWSAKIDGVVARHVTAARKFVFASTSNSRHSRRTTSRSHEGCTALVENGSSLTAVYMTINVVKHTRNSITLAVGENVSRRGRALCRSVSDAYFSNMYQPRVLVDTVLIVVRAQQVVIFGLVCPLGL